MARSRIGVRSNPTLSDRVFEQARAADAAGAMTVSGTVNKTILLTGVVACAAVWVWFRAVGSGGLDRTDPAQVAKVFHRAQPFLLAGLVGFVIAIVNAFKPPLARYTAVVYALCEGLFIGALASMLETQYGGIAIQAAGLTFGVLAGMLVIYKTGVIEVTDRFRRGVMMGIVAVLLVYLATFVLGFFGLSIPYIHGSGPIGILFSVGVIVLAALTLIVDFDMIEQGERGGAPRYMEWYGAFALMVTLVWLYVEILRLLAKLRDR